MSSYRYEIVKGRVVIKSNKDDCTACVVLSLDNARKLRDYLNEVLKYE